MAIVVCRSSYSVDFLTEDLLERFHTACSGRRHRRQAAVWHGPVLMDIVWAGRADTSQHHSADAGNQRCVKNFSGTSVSNEGYLQCGMAVWVVHAGIISEIELDRWAALVSMHQRNKLIKLHENSDFVLSI